MTASRGLVRRPQRFPPPARPGRGARPLLGVALAWLGLALGPPAASAEPTHSAHAFHIEVVDADSGALTPAVGHLELPAAGPRPVVVGQELLRRQVGPHYFYTDGRIEIRYPGDQLELALTRGPEYRELHRVVERSEATAESPLRLALERVIDMKARGYYSGDGHVHARFSYRRRELSRERIVSMMEAEDLDLVNLLNANDSANRVFGFPVTGRDEPASRPGRILRVSEEYRAYNFGHVVVYGAKVQNPTPFSGFGFSQRSYDQPTNFEAARAYREQGALLSVSHLTRLGELAQQTALALETPVQPMAPVPKHAANEGPADIILGAITAIELMGYQTPSFDTRWIWEQLLGSGFDVVLTGGTDAILDQRVPGRMGGVRSYVPLGDEALGYERYVEGLRAGRGFVTSGPMVFLEVDGARPGDEIVLQPGEARWVDVRIGVESVHPWERAELRVDGAIAARFESDGALRQELQARVRLDGPGYIYAHVDGPRGLALIPFGRGTTPLVLEANTNPVWVRRGEEERLDPVSLDFLVWWLDDNLQNLDRRNQYGPPDDAGARGRVRDVFLRARREVEARRARAAWP